MLRLPNIPADVAEACAYAKDLLDNYAAPLLSFSGDFESAMDFIKD